MKTLTLILAVLGWAGAVAASDGPLPVGAGTLDLPGIETVVLYPTSSAAPTSLLADNPVFVGVPVVRDGAVAAGVHPVALLSHGYSGLWRNQIWLAEELARAGYIAVLPSHPGTTFGDMDPSWALHPADRPQQMSRVLDGLLADAEFAAHIDASRISVIGHSLGGSTALMMAGGEFSGPRLMEACGGSTDKLVCLLYRNGGAGQSTTPASARDPRITAAVLLDMEGIQGFTPESLADLSIPVLALAAGIEDPRLPLGWESRMQSQRLPAATSRYAEMIGATHFTFMSECKPGAEEILEEDAYICQGETAPRATLHQEIAAIILRFLNAGTQLESALQSL
jgi:predicted dienelactone hydrolase